MLQLMDNDDDAISDEQNKLLLNKKNRNYSSSFSWVNCINKGERQKVKVKLTLGFVGESVLEARERLVSDVFCSRNSCTIKSKSKVILYYTIDKRTCLQSTSCHAGQHKSTVTQATYNNRV